MTTEEILIVAGVVVALLVVLGLVIWFVGARRSKHRDQLRDRYGREYEATVEAKGRRAGVDDLDQREAERREVSLREPDESLRAELRRRMAELQFRFVEEPHEVLLETQRVVVDGLRARGYPIAEDRERALRLLSVDHPDETPPLRTLLDSSYGQDAGHMRELFLEARHALLVVLDVSYSRRDLPGARPEPEAGRPEPEQPTRRREPEQPPTRPEPEQPPRRREPEPEPEARRPEPAAEPVPRRSEPPAP